MRLDEIERSRARLFDAPAHFYNQAVRNAAAWLMSTVLGDEAQAFSHETKLYFIAGFLRRRHQDYRAKQVHGALHELARFAWTFAIKSRDQL